MSQNRIAFLSNRFACELLNIIKIVHVTRRFVNNKNNNNNNCDKIIKLIFALYTSFHLGNHIGICVVGILCGFAS
jgi:hypothetical protein